MPSSPNCRKPAFSARELGLPGALAALVAATTACTPPSDSGVLDASVLDASKVDSSVVDASGVDGGVWDAGPVSDAAVWDAPAPDAASVDAAVTADATPPDAAEQPDAAPPSQCYSEAAADAGPLGAPPITLSNNTGADPELDVSAFKLSPDGNWVVFYGDPDTDGDLGLYTVPVAGGAVNRLDSGATLAPGFNGRIAITPDSATVLWLGDGDTDGVRRLISSPIGGGTPVVISSNTDESSTAEIRNFKLNPNGTSVAFLGDMEVDEAFRLYAVGIDGMGETLLSHSDSDEFEEVTDYAFTPDGSRVLFRGDSSGEGLFRLHSVPALGGTIVQISPNTSADPDLRVGGRFVFSPNSATVLFAGDPEIDGVARLYSAPVAGGAITVLWDNPDSTAGLSPGGYEVTPDGQRVVVYGDLDTDGLSQLYSIPLAGGGATLLSGTAEFIAEDYNYVVLPDSSGVVFVAEQPDSVRRLYRALWSGGQPTVLSPNVGLIPDLGVYYPVVSADSRFAAYVGDPEVEDVLRIYSTCLLDGTTVAVSPNTGLDPDVGYTTGVPVFEPSGNHVFFIGDALVDSAIQLYRSRSDVRTAEVVDDNTGAVPGRFVDNDIAVSSTGSHVVFIGDTDGDGVTRLYSRAI